MGIESNRSSHTVPSASEGMSVKNPRLLALVCNWNEKRGSRSMPSRQQIDPIEIPRLLPIVLVAERIAGGARIRLLGTESTNAYGRETRGKLVAEVAFGEFTPFWLNAFGRVTETGVPITAGGSFSSTDQHHRVEMVLIPLSDDGVSGQPYLRRTDDNADANEQSNKLESVPSLFAASSHRIGSGISRRR